MSVSPELARTLAKRHKPLLVLYPEINTARREDGRRADWKKRDVAPLLADYHPRDITLALEHARVRRSAASMKPVHDGTAVLDAMSAGGADHIDILDGVGPSDRDRFWSEYYGIVKNVAPHDRDGPYAIRSYARVVDGAGAVRPEHAPFIAIEYWLFYLYNDWKATHEGDWELAVVLLRRDGSGATRPVACAYSAHHGGLRLAWRHVEKADDAGQQATDGSHPIIYVANGSHANYFFGPARYHTSTERFGLRVRGGEFPFTGEFVDYTTSFDAGTVLFPDVALVPEPSATGWPREWRWLNFEGEWGSPGVPRPLAPLLRVMPKRVRFILQRKIWGAPASLPARPNWSDPFSWVDRECEEAPVPGSWLAMQY